MNNYKLFFVVLARDRKYVFSKIKELEQLKVPYVIICGEKIKHPKVIYRPPKGKYDAINYAVRFIPSNTDIIVFNDVDTRILSYEPALKYFKDNKVAVVYTLEEVPEGPQSLFFKVFNPIRSRIPLASTGELLMIRRKILFRMIPLPPTKAEDTYIIFKSLEMGYKVIGCKEAKIITYRTKRPQEEERYKERTVTGILQSLQHTRPPLLIRAAYLILPFLTPIFIITLGIIGYYISKGIIKAYIKCYVYKDKGGYWK